MTSPPSKNIFVFLRKWFRFTPAFSPINRDSNPNNKQSDYKTDVYKRQENDLTHIEIDISKVPDTARFLWLQLTDGVGHKAWMNPYYLKD